MRKSKIFTMIVTILVCILSISALVACDPTGTACEHSYGEWQQEKAATCEVTGLKKHKCDKCGEWQEEEIPALGHEWGEWAVTEDATLTQTGKKERACCVKGCDKKETEIIPIIVPCENHNYADNDWVIDNEPNCTDAGLKHHYCKVCGLKQEEVIPANGHTLTHNAKIDASCTQAGTKENWKCDVCKKYFSDAEGKNVIAEADLVINQLPHSYTQQHNDTYHWNECVCGDIKDKVAHSFGSMIEVTPPSCTGAGLGKYVCECGYEKQIQLPQVEHDWETEWKYDDAAHWHKCKNCEEKNMMQAHIYHDDGSCMLCDYSMASELGSQGLVYEVLDPSEGTAKLTSIGTFTGQELVVPDKCIIEGRFYSVAEIEKGALKYSTPGLYLTKITLPFVGKEKNGTTQAHLGYVFGAFQYDANATYVPATLREVVVTGGSRIYMGAFRNCSNLTSITLPEGIISIEDKAFSGCTNLTNISIPSSVTRIEEDYAFNGCTSLQKNEYNNAYYLGNEDNPYVVLLEAKDKTITSCEINPNTKIIYAYAFKECTSLTGHLVIPEGVTDIAKEAFYGCSGLNGELVIPNSVTYIGTNAFRYCSGITTARIGNGITEVKVKAFDGCTKLKAVYITDLEAWLNIGFAEKPSNPLCNGANLYLNDQLVTQLVIPSGVTRIGIYAFASCASITSVVIPNSVTSIGKNSFVVCNAFKEIYYNGTAEEWNNVTIEEYNVAVNNATRYYYSETEPTETGNYWHYVDGVVTKW